MSYRHIGDLWNLGLVFGKRYEMAAAAQRNHFVCWFLVWAVAQRLTRIPWPIGQMVPTFFRPQAQRQETAPRENGTYLGGTN
jgi:hypothetical protein